MNRIVLIYSDEALLHLDSTDGELSLLPGAFSALLRLRAAGYNFLFVPSLTLTQGEGGRRRLRFIQKLLLNEGILLEQCSIDKLGPGITLDDIILIVPEGRESDSVSAPERILLHHGPEGFLSWADIVVQAAEPPRKAQVGRVTKETAIQVNLNLDRNGDSSIKTGIGFFDHMLELLIRHANCEAQISAAGDLHVDEHHTVEDTALALGSAFAQALGNKAGISRYGFMLPMDDALAEAALDLSGRSRLVWEVEFKREKIGELPTELIFHFFKSFCDTAGCNLHIKAHGENEHHKAEAVFKALGRVLRQAVRRDGNDAGIPSTKGIL